MNSIRTLVVNGSAKVRQALADLLDADPSIEVFAAVADPFLAVKRIEDEVPDVIVLDADLPRMDGVSFLKKLMSQHPIPVVMLVAANDEDDALAVAAAQAGAADVLIRPVDGVAEFVIENADAIVEAVKDAFGSRRKKNRIKSPMRDVQPKLSADVVLPPPTKWAKVKVTEKVICIGASTGGTESLRVVLEKLPADTPGVVVVQHMPGGFTDTFSKRLDTLCAMRVKEAANGDMVERGLVLIAPGGMHMLIRNSGNRYVIDLKDGPPVSRHRPSVDVMFRSAARTAGSNALGIILTGMGDDGAQGLLEMRQCGAHTIAEDESTCVVFGMPKEAIARGGAKAVVRLNDVPEHIRKWSY